MSKQLKSFRDQMRQSLAELESIISDRRSPTGDGRLTVRVIEVAKPSVHTKHTVRGIRASLGVSQAVFADLLGVSAALVRAWELGNRTPSPIARRMLDQVKSKPGDFAALIQPARPAPSRRRVA